MMRHLAAAGAMGGYCVSSLLYSNTLSPTRTRDTFMGKAIFIWLSYLVQNWIVLQFSGQNPTGSANVKISDLPTVVFMWPSLL